MTVSKLLFLKVLMGLILKEKKHIYSLSLFFLFFFEGLISSFISITLAPGNSLIRKMSAFQDDPLLFHPKGQDALNYGVELSY